ncbi:hypothetical protein RIF29_31095 [Crotalaria pallida]|uniref:inorganic diphosphatase n=1 Tax=Crotalaria pallida TaxID=3830 RepID=A0AAN9EGU7_CROPI
MVVLGFSQSDAEAVLSNVVEIGEMERVKQRKIGEVLGVKPLAALAMIDEGELDRKIVAILLNDPKASLAIFFLFFMYFYYYLTL